MPANIGKKFEAKFREDWARTVKNSFLLRLADQVSGYAGSSSNPCDFIGYKFPKLFLLECKSHKGNTWPLTNFRQYEKLSSYKDIPGVIPGVVLWFQDHDVVCFVHIAEIEKMKNDGKKSIQIDFIKNDLYNIVVIPSTKKRVFMESDYSILENYEYIE